MLGMVRQLREEMAKLQNRLRQATDSHSAFGGKGSDVADSEVISEEDKMKQQVMLGKESLERTSQSLAR